MTEREQEIKLELASEEDRDRLIAALPPSTRRKRQANHYYDLPGLELRGAGVLLRLRLETIKRPEHSPRQRARVTVKERATRDGEGLFDSIEREFDVPVEAAEAVVGGDAGFETLGGEVLDALAARFGALAGLRRWGVLENERSVHPFGEWELEVDRAVYPGGVVLREVELESERPEEARARLTALLGRLGIAATPSSMSKSERLAQAADEATRRDGDGGR